MAYFQKFTEFISNRFEYNFAHFHISQIYFLSKNIPNFTHFLEPNVLNIN